MSRWTTTLTNIGKENIANAIANGKTITITRAKASKVVSDGAEEILKSKTDVDDYVKDFNIVSARQVDNSVNLIIQLNSENIITKFNLKQIGIFAKINDEQEFLWFLQQCDDTGDVVDVDRENVNKSVLEYSYTIDITSEAKISAQLNQSAFISFQNFNETIDYLGSLIDKNTVECTQNYIKFGNNIALLWGRVHEIDTGEVKYVDFPEELNISTVLNIQICNRYVVQNLNTDDINKRTKLFGEPSSKGFSYINYIINECLFYWFAIVLIE